MTTEQEMRDMIAQCREFFNILHIDDLSEICLAQQNLKNFGRYSEEDISCVRNIFNKIKDEPVKYKQSVMHMFMDKCPDIIQLSECLDKIELMEQCLDCMDKDNTMLMNQLDCFKNRLREQIGMMVQDLINKDEDEEDEECEF